MTPDIGALHPNLPLGFLCEGTHLQLFHTQTGRILLDTELGMPIHSSDVSINHFAFTPTHLLSHRNLKSPSSFWAMVERRPTRYGPAEGFAIDLTTLNVSIEHEAHAILTQAVNNRSILTLPALPHPAQVGSTANLRKKPVDIKAITELGPGHYLAAIWDSFPDEAQIIQIRQGGSSEQDDYFAPVKSFADHLHVERAKDLSYLLVRSHHMNPTWAVATITATNTAANLTTILEGEGFASFQNGKLYSFQDTELHEVQLPSKGSELVQVAREGPPMEIAEELELT